jgi:hypothetical protein
MKTKDSSRWKEFLFFGGKTVHERARLLASSGERNRLDLSPEHVLALLEKYPDKQVTRKPCQTRVPVLLDRRYWLCFT